MTPVKPPARYKQQSYKVRIQDSASTTLPQTLVNPHGYSSVEVRLMMNQKDHFTGKYGLVEVRLI